MNHDTAFTISTKAGRVADSRVQSATTRKLLAAHMPASCTWGYPEHENKGTLYERGFPRDKLTFLCSKMHIQLGPVTQSRKLWKVSDFLVALVMEINVCSLHPQAATDWEGNACKYVWSK